MSRPAIGKELAVDLPAADDIDIVVWKLILKGKGLVHPVDRCHSLFFIIPVPCEYHIGTSRKGLASRQALHGLPSHDDDLSQSLLAEQLLVLRDRPPEDGLCFQWPSFYLLLRSDSFYRLHL